MGIIIPYVKPQASMICLGVVFVAFGTPLYCSICPVKMSHPFIQMALIATLLTAKKIKRRRLLTYVHGIQRLNDYKTLPLSNIMT